MKTIVKENTWLPFTPHGWGNGYVIIPKGHPLHGIGYGDIDVDVHGGLTFSQPVNECIEWAEIKEKDKDGWIVGFDTAHYSDSLFNWPKSRVIKETNNLKNS